MIGIRIGCEAKKPVDSFEGEPFDTLPGRRKVTPITSRTLTATKNTD
jgi:hypothetical protein